MFVVFFYLLRDKLHLVHKYSNINLKTFIIILIQVRFAFYHIINIYIVETFLLLKPSKL